MGRVDEPTVSPAGDRLVAGALVAGQLALLTALLAPAPGRRSFGGAALGGVLIVGGGGLALTGALALGPALTPSPLPAAGGELRTGGPYAWLRHPVYAGLATAAWGRALGTGARRHGLAAAALSALFAVKARVEERRLVARYPAYADYARHTPALLGRPGRLGTGGGR